MSEQILVDAARREIEVLRQLSEIEREAGLTQSTWQIIRDIALRLENAVAATERIERVDQALARQLSRSMQENARLQIRITELESRHG